MRWFIVPCAAVCAVSGSALAEIVRPEDPVLSVLPGSQIRSVWLIAGATTPLFGYSLDMNLALGEGAEGSVGVNAGASTFFPPRNIYMAAGHALDPLFTVMQGDGAGGVFLNTNAADFASVLPITGVNDAFAELAIDISADAAGEFIFSLGPGSALSDAGGFGVPFTGETLTIRVIPGPGTGVALCGVFGLAFRRRR